MTQNQAFPYDVISSPFPAAQNIAVQIAALPERDWSLSVQEAGIIVSAMAAENGFAWLWTPEERAVAAILKSLFSGPRTAHYGWRLYARYRDRGVVDTDGVGY